MDRLNSQYHTDGDVFRGSLWAVGGQKMESDSARLERCYLCGR